MKEIFIYWFIPALIAYLLMLLIGLVATDKTIRELYRTEHNTMYTVLIAAIMYPVAYAIMIYYLVLPTPWILFKKLIRK